VPDEKPILVVGGGMAGITAALEAAEVGHHVILVERNAYLGGRVAQMYKYFPKLCPPSCGLEINYKRLKANPRIDVRPLTSVAAVSGEAGAFEVSLNTAPRFVNERCTCCGDCEKACEMEVDDPFNYGMNKKKAASRPHTNAYPALYQLAPELVADPAQAKKVADTCPCDAIDLDDAERADHLDVGSIIWATGWDPYDPTKIDYYGYGKHPDLITNVMMERLAADDGPTAGKILRPSNGEAPRKVVFVQCAGSRDENHLAYCSGICCLASLKQATYVREQLPETEVTICFIDIRTPDRLEDFYTRVQQDEGVTFVKSKIADITPTETGGQLLVNGEDTAANKRFQTEADLVVLATGIVPCKPGVGVNTDDYGFFAGEQAAGQFAAGCNTKPTDVSSTTQDGTAAALKAIQTIGR